MVVVYLDLLVSHTRLTSALGTFSESPRINKGASMRALSRVSAVAHIPIIPSTHNPRLTAAINIFIIIFHIFLCLYIYYPKIIVFSLYFLVDLLLCSLQLSLNRRAFH